MQHMTKPENSLRREIGIIGAVMMGLGAIIGTGIFIGIGDAARVAGDWVVLSIALAAIVASLNGLSSAQLAAAHPVSGGTYEYGYRWLHPSLGFTAGWLFLCAKSASAATAALGFAGYALRFLQMDTDQLQKPIALFCLVIVIAFVLKGIRLSSALNTFVVSTTLVSLLIFITAGALSLVFADTRPGLSTLEIIEQSTTSLKGILEGCALMFVAYTGYGRIATMGEEVRNPSKNIPTAILLTLGVAMLVYLLVAWVSIGTVGAQSLGETAITKGVPLEMVASHFNAPWVKNVVTFGAMTSMLGVLINLALGLSRVVLAMGRREDLPSVLSRIDEARKSPTNAVVAVGTLIACLILVGNVKLTWSLSAFTVLIYYAITNLAALRMSDQERRYPRILALLGLSSCLFLAFWVDPYVWIVGLGIIGIGLVWWRFGRHCLSGFSSKRG
jgi:APA family basic amino acid/polyamine antiporter